jgi:CRP-like cAMP-binding protein/predicted GNAT family N-acyltransferase
MSITLKVAHSPKELDDALWLRHEVYVVEDGKFGGTPLPGERIVDRYDVLPDVAHLIAYEGDEPVATLRVNCDRGGGLPSEEYYDFGSLRKEFQEEFGLEPEGKPVISCGGMLAVREAWRSRRDVIRALYKIAASVFVSWGTTHIIATVNFETASMYRRLGFRELADKRWVEEIGNFVIPLAAHAQDYYDWAFGNLIGPPLEIFRDSFERLLLRSGELVFEEGETGNRAYVIDSGNVKISRARPDGTKLVLAILGRGDLFGELALIDDLPRSATAESLGDVELISLDRDLFSRQTGMDSKRMRAVMNFFSSRMRKTDELAMVLAFEEPQRRLEFALDTIRTGARPDSKEPDVLVAKVMAEDVARAALVEKEQAEVFLKGLEERGDIRLGRRSIRFLN